VLILGRFTDERKAILEALRDELRKRDYLPILFDFDKPDSKDLTGTVTTLANIVRFIVADGTGPKSIPHELATIVPTNIVPGAADPSGRRARIGDVRRPTTQIPLGPSYAPLRMQGATHRRFGPVRDPTGAREGR
jgi:hypothetical protein